MKLRVILTLMLCMFSAYNAASEPFAANDDEQSMHAAEEDSGYLGRGEALAAFPQSQSSTRDSCNLSPSHRAIDIDTLNGAGGGTIADAARSAAPSAASMKSFSQVNSGELFNREQYLKDQVREMIEDEKRFKTTSRVCRGCNAFWVVVGSISTVSSLVISAIGATEYIDPRLSNILSVVFGIISGGCLWAASQSKKASNKYYEEATAIQKALGVPKQLLEPEVNLNLDAFKSDAGGRSADVPAVAH
jgi:hypothetical protein